MAYLPYRPEDEDELQPGQAPVLGGEAAMVQPGAATTGAPPPSAPPPGSGEGTGFVDIRRYLEMNAPKTEALAGRIGGDVESKAEESEKAIDLGKSEFEKTAREQNAPDKEWVSTALSQPLKTVEDPLAAERFSALRTGTYRGPSELDVTQYQPGVTSAQERGELVSTPGGLEELMAGYSSDPTRGKAGLNTALLQQSPEAQSRLAAAKARTAALSDYLSGARTATQGTSAELQDALTKFAPTVGKMGDAAAGTMGDTLNEAYQKAAVESLRNINKPIYDLRQDVYDQWKDLYTDPVQASKVYVEGMPEYHSTKPYGLSQYASPEAFAREKALETLMGKEYDVLKNAEVGQAGTYGQAEKLLAQDAAKRAEDFDLDWGYSNLTRGPFMKSPTWDEWLERSGMSGWA